MSTTQVNNWQDVQSVVYARIRARIWRPGDLIPGEAELAKEFGCARATVNRALRGLAESGLLERRRKAGTRVALHPVRKATLDIPIIRHEVEGRNQRHGYALIASKTATPPASVAAAMALSENPNTLQITALHMADGKPFVFEDRWVNLEAVPEIVEADLRTISANEWLVMHAPFTHGELALSAIKANDALADNLGAEPGEALFTLERVTWTGPEAVTCAKLIYAPGYRMHTRL